MASLSPAQSRFNFDWREFAQSSGAVLALWAAYVLVRLALLPVTGVRPVGPDDYMRLLEVRDLLNGQSWFDVSQYRMDPPHGASMHWSRLVDLPLAAGFVLFGLILPKVAAEQATMILVPLLYLLPVLFALRSIAMRLGMTPPVVLATLAILPLFPMLPSNFAPMRIDHHTAQSVAAIGCAALLLRDSRLSAIACGVLAAMWLTISLEALPMVATLAGLYGVRYWLARDLLLQWFLVALAFAAPMLALATRPVGAFSEPYSDILLPGHMVAFALAAGLSVYLPNAPAQNCPRARLLSLCLIPICCGPLALWALGARAINPFDRLDPLLMQYWYGFITEGLPIWHQPPSTALMLVWTIALIPVGWRLASREGLAAGARALRWHLLALFALAGGVYSLLLLREVMIAQILTIPFSALILNAFLPSARGLRAAIPRIVATIACLVLCTPTFASGALKPFDGILVGKSLRTEALAQLEGPACDYTRLTALPRGHIFAPLDRGPEILALTSHTVVMAGYHRNVSKMREVAASFIGDPDSAEQIVRANRADYVVVCSSGKDIAVYRTVRPDNLANVLAEARPPQWLAPISGFDQGSLRVYRVQ